MANYKIIIAMLVLAIFAVGAVSAAEDIAIEDNIIEPAGDVVVEDVAADEIDESAGDVETDDIAADVNEESRTVPALTYTQVNITTGSNFTDINAKINNRTYHNIEFVFQSGEYENFSMVTGDNNSFIGGTGVILKGLSDNLFNVAGSSNIIITGFNMQVATGKAAVYGANVFNADITNNNISGGKDGINIMQTYDDITISGNTITGFTRDGISLVDHRNLTETQWSNRDNSIISNNIIEGISIANTEVGMFIGGNFKGEISDNKISKVAEGVEFTGKKDKTNGRLSADFDNNTISNVTYGLYMNNHNIVYFNITNCDIGLNSSSISFAIFATANHQKVAGGYIGIFNLNYNGTIHNRFNNTVDDYVNVIQYP